MAGSTFAGVYAQMASAHMEQHGTTKEDLSRVSVKNHKHGAENPKAHLQFTCSLEDAMDAPTVADPLTLYHCCPTTDGASAVIVASEEVATASPEEPIRVAGAGAASDRVAVFQRETVAGIPASERAAENAYEEAGIDPTAVDFAEVHDCFAIAELLAYEDLGFCKRGEAATLLSKGETEQGGSIPVNLSGGLKAKGHPIGATGTGQLYEVYKQLRGEAANQLSEPRVGLAHNVGGSGGAVTVHILQREGGEA
jgi:acetyl-CoA acetyltransferase